MPPRQNNAKCIKANSLTDDLPEITTPKGCDLDLFADGSYSFEETSNNHDFIETNWKCKNKSINRRPLPTFQKPLISITMPSKNQLATKDIKKDFITKNTSQSSDVLTNDFQQIIQISKTSKESDDTKQLHIEDPNLVLIQGDIFPIKNNILNQSQTRDNRQIFQIFYNQKKLQTNWKRTIQMNENGCLLYITNSFKIKEFGKTHIICTKPPVSIHSQNLVAILIHHQNGSRFTLYKINNNNNKSTLNPQLAGISFVNYKGSRKVRVFRVAIPNNGYEYISTCKDEDLSKIAQKGISIPNVNIFHTSIPIKVNDVLKIIFEQSNSAIKSQKNFIIKGDNNSQLFTFFKLFNGICTLILEPPFTSLIGFAITVAILTSNK